jgi:hypothetical protein
MYAAKTLRKIGAEDENFRAAISPRVRVGFMKEDRAIQSKTSPS